MADRCHAEITIGGTLPKAMLMEFLKNVSEEMDLGDIDDMDLEDMMGELEQQLLDDKGRVHIEQDEVSGGSFSALESFCRLYKLPYVRVTSGSSYIQTGKVYWDVTMNVDEEKSAVMNLSLDTEYAPAEVLFRLLDVLEPTRRAVPATLERACRIIREQLCVKQVVIPRFEVV
jgi:sulfopyruvate decarboxylase TPP-binding subunit